MTGQLLESNMDQLEAMIGMGPKIFTLLYKITTDGCNATTFHQKCDNKGPTVTVLYNPQGSVYGGYGSVSWNSSSTYIKDANAFLFQLKYSDSKKPYKFPVKSAEHGLYGASTYGPTFGGGFDLYTFTGTVNSSGGYFALNGYVSFGNSFNIQGVSADHIHNGNLNVTELEVYGIADGQRTKSPVPQTWRKNPEWNEKFLEALTEDIVSFNPSGELGLSDVRNLMLGPVGTGKSSFYNTINSVFKGRITQRAPSGIGTQSITTAYTPYVVKARSGSPLHFRFCDTRGLEVPQGLDNVECNYLLDGNISDFYEFNPATPICPENPGFVYQPTVKDKIHCVLFVIDAGTVGDIPPKLIEKINSFQRIENRKGIPKAVLLTKVDLACKDVASNVTNVFTSKKIEDAVDKVSGLLGLPRNNILPVKNYENEMQLDDNINILALLALRQLLHFAEDYLENLQEKMNGRNFSTEKPHKLDKLSDKE